MLNNIPQSKIIEIYLLANHYTVGFWLILRWLCWYYVGYVGVRYLTPYFGYIIFYPHIVWSVKCLAPESPKRIIQKKRQQQIRNEDVSLILSFIYWVQQPFHGWGSFSWIHCNSWIPHLRCQNTLFVFMYVCVRIWYFGLP